MINVINNRRLIKRLLQFVGNPNSSPRVAVLTDVRRYITVWRVMAEQCETDLLLILCHPDAKSFTHALGDIVRKESGRRGLSAVSVDLYTSGFHPVLTGEELRRGMSFDEHVLRYQALLCSARRLVLVHPDWWGGPPALLKGWVERVLRPQVAYLFTGQEFMPKVKEGLLGHLSVLVAYTTDTKEEAARNSVERFWGSSVFEFCGARDVEFAGFYELYSLAPGTRTRLLRQFRKQVSSWLNHASGPGTALSASAR